MNIVSVKQKTVTGRKKIQHSPDVTFEWTAKAAVDEMEWWWRHCLPVWTAERLSRSSWSEK